ncbi:MAG TPA: glycosyltransferase family 39 protein, partial [Bacteroidia bacterium]
MNTRHQLILLVIVVVGLNVNTLFNKYAVDDGVVLVENNIVAKGIAGVPELFRTDLFSGYKNKEAYAAFSKTRYRPFSLVIFALEHQFFGANPFVSHLLNVIFFALLVVLLYKFQQSYVFIGKNKNMSLVACLLFAVHPIHTEVVANVKSRDEIIAFILLMASLLLFLKYHERRKFMHYISGLFCFFLALLTRESAITFIGVVPLVLYFFCNRSIRQSLSFVLPMSTVFFVYWLLRFYVVDSESLAKTNILCSP